MGGFVDLNVFDDKEIEGLSAKELRQLHKAVHRELTRSPEIRKILRAKTRTVHQRLTMQSAKRAKTGAVASAGAKPKARRKPKG